MPTSPLLTLACLPGSSEPLPEPPRFPVHRPLWPRRGPWLVVTVRPSPLCLPPDSKIDQGDTETRWRGSLELPLGVGAGPCCPGPCAFPLRVCSRLWHPHAPFFFCHLPCFSDPPFNCPYSEIAASVCPLAGALMSAAAAWQLRRSSPCICPAGRQPGASIGHS